MKDLKILIKILFSKGSILEQIHTLNGRLATTYRIELSDLRKITMTEEEISEFNYHLHKLWNLVK